MAVKKDEKTKTWYYYGRIKLFDGSYKQYKKRGFKTKKEAKEAEIIKRLQLSESYCDLTCEQFYKLYFKDKEYLTKTTTNKTAQNIIKNHFLKYFNDIKIAKITPKQITEWHKTLANDTDLKESSLNKVYAIVSTSFNYAYKKQFINSNPFNFATRYKIPNKLKTPQNAQENYLEIDDFNKLIENTDKDKYKLIFNFLFYTGVRFGEFQALKWKDIDLNNNKVDINKNYNIFNKLTSLKTSNSYRVISIPKFLSEDLKKKYEYDCLYDGFNDDYYVFGRDKPIDRKHIRVILKKYCDKANIKNITVHGFRHSHASYLLEYSNIPDTLIAERLGHSTQMLLNTYNHIYSKRRDELTNFIENL